MRPLVLASLLVGLAACDAGRGTGPESSVITVRVRDANGVSAGPNQVLVTLATGTLSARTDRDGTAAIAVAGAGTYRVTIVPRDGFVGGTAGLSRTVAVGPGAPAVVEFTVYRAGAGPEEPHMENWGPY